MISGRSSRISLNSSTVTEGVNQSEGREWFNKVLKYLSWYVVIEGTASTEVGKYDFT